LTDFRFTEWPEEAEPPPAVGRTHHLGKTYGVVVLTLVLLAGALGGIVGTSLALRLPLSQSNFIESAMFGAIWGLTPGMLVGLGIWHFVSGKATKWGIGLVGAQLAAWLSAAIIDYYITALIASA